MFWEDDPGIFLLFSLSHGPGSVVGVATGYGLDGPGIESRWGRDFPHLSKPALGPPSLLYSGCRVFSGGKEQPGRDAVPSPLLVPWSRKSRAIPLFPLLAVQPVQSLSACTRVYFNFYLSLFQDSHSGPTRKRTNVKHLP